MDFEDEIEVDYKGKDLQVSFNPKFILDLLKAVGEKNLIMDFTSPSTPAMARVPGNEDLLYIVMPLRIQ
jgi:DNA polymerase-3 subunit beta